MVSAAVGGTDGTPCRGMDPCLQPVPALEAPNRTRLVIVAVNHELPSR